MFIIYTVSMKGLTIKWHILQYDWSVRPIFITAFSYKNTLRYFSKFRRKSNVCAIRYDWLISLYIFILFVRNTSFSIIKNSCVGEDLSNLPFFLLKNCNKSLWKKILLVSFHSWPSPLVRVPPYLTIFPSPTYFLLWPFISASPSTAAPFERKTVSNASNAL